MKRTVTRLSLAAIVGLSTMSFATPAQAYPVVAGVQGSVGSALACNGAFCVTVQAQGITRYDGLVAFSCEAVAPGAIFTNVSCAGLTAGANGPASSVSGAYAASTTEFCFSGKGLFGPSNTYVPVSGCTTSVGVAVVTDSSGDLCVAGDPGGAPLCVPADDLTRRIDELISVY